MYFEHSSEIWHDFPELVPGVLSTGGITADAAVEARLVPFTDSARGRLAASPEGELPEVQAWRRAFTKMGLKPTQYRSASESLLRRFRKEGSLPHLHPLIDVCNAISVAFAIPVAVFDRSRISGHLEVRYATGEESYATFSGETESPAPHEVVFADGEGRAHARRWTNRQSGFSAVRAETREVLIVAEALHGGAQADVERLVQALVDELHAVWDVTATASVLTPLSPRFDC
jgi:DNA/RNA-binding domain of Phe-tRNA-synthetase-like protein